MIQSLSQRIPRSLTGLFALMVFCGMLLIDASDLQAQLTTEHRRTLTELRRDVSRVSSLIRQKEYDEAETALSEAEDSLKQIASEAGLEEDDRVFSSVQRTIEGQRRNLARATGEAMPGNAGVSFSKDVAPILSEKCVGCHDDGAAGGLRLDTFAGMRRGGRSGVLLVPGSANRSLLALKLIANPPARMPKNGNPLPQEEIETIAAWIAQGAKFDGTDQNMTMSELAASSDGKKMPEIKVAKPDGTETVSFTKDIAPMLVTFCHGCHSGANPNSGFSVETFEKILIGGDSGEVLIPGNLEDSRLFRLTGGLENPRMPQGQARITRKNYEDLKAWISEGIKFDGNDPKQPLLEMVPSASDERRMQLANMTPQEFEKHRRDQGDSHWRRTLSSANPASVTNDNLLVMGNVDPQRLQTVLDWAEQMRSGLKSKLALAKEPEWKGRLAIYVFKDRYDYEEFNRSIENRQATDLMFGHARVTSGYDMAYVAVLDTGDVASATTPSLKWTLSKGMISAALQRDSTTRVDWLTEGAGWALADSELRNAEFERALFNSASRAIKGVNRPRDVFQPGTFSPDVTEHVGLVTVRLLMSRGTPNQLKQFSEALLLGRSIEEACRIYNTTPEDLGRAVAASLN